MRPAFSAYTPIPGDNANGYLVNVVDARGGRSIDFVNSARGQVLSRHETRGTQHAGEHHYYYIQGRGVGEVSDTGPSYKDYTVGMQENYKSYRDKKDSGKSPKGGGLLSKMVSQIMDEKNTTNQLFDLKPIFHADFDQNFRPITSEYPAKIPGAYTIMGGENLQDVARSVFGDASLWYLIAQENGLTGSETLKVGLELKIPNVVTNIHNNADTFRPYDAGRAIGDVSPTLPEAPIPKIEDDKGGCGFKQILVAIVAIVVVAIVAPYLLAAVQGMGAAFGTAAVAATATTAATAGTLTLAGSMVVGAGLGALASTVSQLTGMALGVQDSFDFGAVAKGALTGALTAGIAHGIGELAGGSTSWVGKTAKYIKDTPWANAAAQNVVGQGVNMLLGEQKRFDWRSMATSAVGAYATQGIMGKVNQDGTRSGGLGINFGKQTQQISAANVANNLLSSAISEGVSAAIYGRRFDWAGVASGVVQNQVTHALVRSSAGANDMAWSIGMESGFSAGQQNVVNNGKELGEHQKQSTNGTVQKDQLTQRETTTTMDAKVDAAAQSVEATREKNTTTQRSVGVLRSDGNKNDGWNQQAFDDAMNRPFDLTQMPQVTDVTAQGQSTPQGSSTGDPTEVGSVGFDKNGPKISANLISQKAEISGYEVAKGVEIGGVSTENGANINYDDKKLSVGLIAKADFNLIKFTGQDSNGNTRSGGLVLTGGGEASGEVGYKTPSDLLKPADFEIKTTTKLTVDYKISNNDGIAMAGGTRIPLSEVAFNGSVGGGYQGTWDKDGKAQGLYFAGDFGHSAKVVNSSGGIFNTSDVEYSAQFEACAGLGAAACGGERFKFDVDYKVSGTVKVDTQKLYNSSVQFVKGAYSTTVGTIQQIPSSVNDRYINPVKSWLYSNE